jgi:hypothetical protein
MDKLNKEWLNGKPNFYFRYKYKVVEKMIEGTCLNIGCGEHKIPNAINVDYPEVDATNLPYEDNSFDTVLLCDVIEHLIEIDASLALYEASKVARKKVIITVPSFSCLWSNYDILLGHYRRYRRGDKGFYLFGALFPIFYLRKFTSGKTPVLPNWIDTIFYWLSHIQLPFGSTLVIEVKK